MRGRVAGIRVEIPGRGEIAFRHLVLDYNGTIAARGALVRGVRLRLRKLARLLEVAVLTADTFGTVAAALRGEPLLVSRVASGADKERYVRARKREGVVAMGNGSNDLRMLRVATLGVAVLGPEGLDPGLLRYAAVVVRRPEEALDLLLDPKRLVATLRT
jgi:soluble P-type ATPase